MFRKRMRGLLYLNSMGFKLQKGGIYEKIEIEIFGKL
jgi:hypothetical protein